MTASRRSRFSDAKAAVDAFDWQAFSDGLRDAYEPHYRALVVSQATRVLRNTEKGVKAGDTFHADASFVKKWMTAYVGERIKQLTGTTKDMVIEEIRTVLDAGEGLGVTELADQLLDAVGHSAALSPARALLIARTETAIAYNHGAALGYKQDGVEEVLISDGDGDDACAAADGQTWTLDEFLSNPIEHPNCERSASPIYPGE